MSAPVPTSPPPRRSNSPEDRRQSALHFALRWAGDNARGGQPVDVDLILGTASRFDSFLAGQQELL
jgi:hypothetical protein